MITYASEEPIDQKETRAWLAFMKKANKGELKYYILTDTDENVKKWTRVFSTRR